MYMLTRSCESKTAEATLLVPLHQNPDTTLDDKTPIKIMEYLVKLEYIWCLCI